MSALVFFILLILIQVVTALTLDWPTNVAVQMVLNGVLLVVHLFMIRES